MYRKVDKSIVRFDKTYKNLYTICIRFMYVNNVWKSIKTLGINQVISDSRESGQMPGCGCIFLFSRRSLYMHTSAAIRHPY